MKNCDCKTRNNCAIGACFWWQAVYPNGDRIYRTPTPEEVREIEASGRPPLGSAVAPDGKGGVIVVAVAVEPERATLYGKAQTGMRCRFGGPYESGGLIANLLSKIGLGGLK